MLFFPYCSLVLTGRYWKQVLGLQIRQKLVKANTAAVTTINQTHCKEKPKFGYNQFKKNNFSHSATHSFVHHLVVVLSFPAFNQAKEGWVISFSPSLVSKEQLNKKVSGTSLKSVCSGKFHIVKRRKEPIGTNIKQTLTNLKRTLPNHYDRGYSIIICEE